MTNPMSNPTPAGAISRRQSTEQAIQLAIQGKWEEAVQLNRQLLGAFPNDVDTYNRLGKALTELGRYVEARAAYTRAIELDSANTIARKNLARLATLSETGAQRSTGEKVDPDLFVEEIGKTAMAILQQPAPEALARIAAGDRVYLKRQDKGLVVENGRGDFLGRIESRLALRLNKLIDAGNEYAAAIASLDGHGGCRLIIKETYQHPSQAGKPSFPPSGGETFRPYTKDRLLRYDVEEDEAPDDDDGEPGGDWQEEADAHSGDVPLYDRLRQREPGERDDEFEA